MFFIYHVHVFKRVVLRLPGLCTCTEEVSVSFDVGSSVA